MKITQLETYFLSCPLPQPVHTSTSTISQVSEVIVQVSTDAGLTGIGEAHGPFLLRQGQEGLQAVSDILRHLTPLVLGEDPFHVERIWQELFALTYKSVRGVPPLARQQRQVITAISAIDIALWDLMGKATERPVYALLGGALHQRLPAYVTGFYYKDGETLDDLRRETAFYLEQGYRTLKVKVGRLTPEADAERIRVIRETAGADGRSHARCQPGLGPMPQRCMQARLFEPYIGIFWLEDPMPWYDERLYLATAQSSNDHSDCSRGDRVHTFWSTPHDSADGLVDYLIIDSTWAGGLTTWRKAAVIAELYQIPLAAHHDPQIHIHAQAASPTGLHLGIVCRPRTGSAVVRTL